MSLNPHFCALLNKQKSEKRKKKSIFIPTTMRSFKFVGNLQVVKTNLTQALNDPEKNSTEIAIQYLKFNNI